MFCPNCTCELPAVAKFCVRCGSKILPTRINQRLPPLSTEVFPNANPQDSKRAEFLDAEDPSPFAHVKGNKFVVSRHSILPSLCVKCGSSPTDPWLKKTFSWHNPALYFLMVSPVLYVIVALIVQKKIRLAVPLCSTHWSIRRKRQWLAAVFLLGCIPLPTAMAIYIGNDAANVLAIWIGIAMFVVGLVFFGYSSMIRPTYIGSNSAEFKGACPEFLVSLMRSGL